MYMWKDYEETLVIKIVKNASKIFAYRFLTLSLSLGLSCSHFLSHSLSLSFTHSLSLSLSHAHTHTNQHSYTCTRLEHCFYYFDLESICQLFNCKASLRRSKRINVVNRCSLIVRNDNSVQCLFLQRRRWRRHKL